MRLTVLHILKDIFVIVFFVILFFAVTHNSIVRPTPKVAKGKWSIELHQKPLALGMAGHNYLVLKNEQGEIINELHGLPTDAVTGGWKYVGREKTDILHVWEFGRKGIDNKEDQSYGITLLSTDEETALSLWNKGRDCGQKIDLLSIPYPPYGIALRKDTENSNSVAYTLTSCMSLAAKHIGLLTPGWGKNLLETSR